MQHGSDVRPNTRIRWTVLSIIPGTHCVEVRALLLSKGRLILVVLKRQFIENRQIPNEQSERKMAHNELLNHTKLLVVLGYQQGKQLMHMAGDDATDGVVDAFN